MTDRLDEIRARLRDPTQSGRERFLNNAYSDIAYLLAEVERLRTLVLEQRLAGIEDGLIMAEPEK